MSKRNDKHMKSIKTELFQEHGSYCWLCENKFNINELTGHHRVPYRECKCTKKDNVYISCKHCHFDVINNIPYPSEKYEVTMERMRKFRDKNKRK